MSTFLIFGIHSELQKSNWRRLYNTMCYTQSLQHVSDLIEKRLHLNRIHCVASCAQKQDCRYVSHQNIAPRTCLALSNYNVHNSVLGIQATNDCVIYSAIHFQVPQQRFSTTLKEVMTPSEDVSMTSMEQGNMLVTTDKKVMMSSFTGRVVVRTGSNAATRATSHCKCIHPQHNGENTYPNIFKLQHKDEKTYLQAFDFGKETFVPLNIVIEEITDIAVDEEDGVVYIVEKKSSVSMLSISKFCCNGTSKTTLATFKGSWLIASDPVLDSVFYVKVPHRRGKPRIMLLNVNTMVEQIITKLRKSCKCIGADFVNQVIYWIGLPYNNLNRIMSKGYNSRNNKVKQVVALPHHTLERYWLFAANDPVITWCATDDSAKQYFIDIQETRTERKKSYICKRVGRRENGFFIIWKGAFKDITCLILYDSNGSAYRTIPLPSDDMWVV